MVNNALVRPSFQAGGVVLVPLNSHDLWSMLGDISFPRNGILGLGYAGKEVIVTCSGDKVGWEGGVLRRVYAYN